MFFGAREFLPPQVGDGLAQFCRRGMGEVGQGLVAEVGDEHRPQTESHAQHEVASGKLLEERMAVAETAVGIGECAQATLAEVVGLDTLYHILRLDAIGSDILHRAGTHSAGDGREVLQAVEAVVDAPLYQCIHTHPPPGCHQVVVHGHHLPVGQGHHRPGVVVHKHDIAARPEDEEVALHCRDAVAGFYFEQTPCHSVDAECVSVLEMYIGVFVHKQSMAFKQSLPIAT